MQLPTSGVRRAISRALVSQNRRGQNPLSRSAGICEKDDALPTRAVNEHCNNRLEYDFEYYICKAIGIWEMVCDK